jgi:hypothetical protein
VAGEAERLTRDQRAEIAAAGERKLKQRATAKRAWKSWSTARGLHELTLSAEQIARLITALGSVVPTDPEALVTALMQALEGEA